MKERTLFKIAILCFLVGIVPLFFIADNIDLREIDVSEIEGENIGDDVKLLGEVVAVSNTEKVMFLEVAQQKIEIVDVVLFKEEDIMIKEGDYIELVGELDDYNGSVNIIANAVKLR